MKTLFLSLCLVAILPLSATAQFNSGSTGADGALDLSTMNCPNEVCEIQLPESGVLNYTTINVPPTKRLIFRKNSRNTPAILLAQGNIIVDGEINVSAPCAIPYYPVACSGWFPSNLTVKNPGVGGFSGGEPNQNGFGPGAGIAGGDTGGKWVGPLNLVPIVGGSGGAGYTCGYPYYVCFGSGGGGAIVLASSTSITVNSYIKANAHNGGATGGGGAIRLVANSITMNGSLSACGYGAGSCGVIRLESSNLIFTGSSSPLATQAQINPTIVPPTFPQLSISSVGGYPVPPNSGSRYDLIDVLLPNQLPDPVSVGVTAVNIPTGTQVQIGFLSGSPNGTSTPCNLAGSFESSSCMATISNLNRTGGTYLLATATFMPPGSLAKSNPKGKNYVAKVRLESAIGAKQKFTFLNSKGAVIAVKNLNPKFLKEFGM